VGRFRSRLQRELKKFVRLDEAKITQILRGFGEFHSQYLFVHSSLSSCGYITGGPQTVIKAIRNWIGPATLAMPTHTYCYPDPSGFVPVYDAATTPSRVGSITEHFRHGSNVIRTIHPTHSLCAQGPNGATLCRGHEFCDTPCGKGTPYERLIQNDAAVLMFGASMNTYTLFHTAEDAAQAPYLYEPSIYTLRYRKENGNIGEMRMRRQDMSVSRCFSSMDEWLEARGFLYRLKLGLGSLLFIPHARLAHEALVAAMNHDSFLLVAPSARNDFKIKLNV
jgi:aminoglycoside 3-N-acetyltransferase